MERLKILLILGVLFLSCFFATTALLDWICWHTGYYTVAAQESTILD